jgi:transcriptional regulator with XRE-family HTH domain
MKGIKDMNIKIGEQIQILRKEKGLSQEELAQVFNVTNQSVSKWETCQTCPDISILPDIAQYFGVSVDELLGSKPVTSIYNIYLQMHSLISSISDDGEKIDTVYRLARLANACNQNNKKDTVESLIDGKSPLNLSILQGYGDNFGGLATQGNGSIFISSFKDYPVHSIVELQGIYKELSSLCDINVLKVLQKLFYHQKNNIHTGMTVEELVEETTLSETEIWKAFNNLDIKSYNINGESRWRLTHLDTYPLLVTLLMTSSFYK